MPLTITNLQDAIVQLHGTKHVGAVFLSTPSECEVGEAICATLLLLDMCLLAIARVKSVPRANVRRFKP
jgi:hypothetical protein